MLILPRPLLQLLIKVQITYLDEYYLTNYEIEILKKNSAEIASQIPEGSMVIELGSGLVNYPMIRPVVTNIAKKPSKDLLASTGL